MNAVHFKGKSIGNVPLNNMVGLFPFSLCIWMDIISRIRKALISIYFFFCPCKCPETILIKIMDRVLLLQFLFGEQ